MSKLKKEIDEANEAKEAGIEAKMGTGVESRREIKQPFWKEVKKKAKTKGKGKAKNQSQQEPKHSRERTAKKKAPKKLEQALERTGKNQGQKRTGKRQESGVQDQAQKSAKSAMYGSIFMAVVLAVNVIYVVASGQLESTFEVLHDLELGWLFFCIGAMVVYLLLGTLAYIFAALLSDKVRAGILDLLSVEAAGTFYGNLTPMMIGSLPAQIWRLIKAGFRFGEATAIQVIRFSIYQFAQVVLAAMLLIGTWNEFSHHYAGLLWLNFILFALKLAQLVLLIAVAFFPQGVIKITSAFFSFSKKHQISFLEKRADGWQVQIKDEVYKFKTAFQTSLKKPRMLIWILIASLGQISILYISPWIIMRAFSVHINFWEAFTAGTMVQFASSSIPLPGGTGGIEASFIAYFSPYLGFLTVPVYLVWRLLTYYGYTVFAGITSNLYTKPTSPTLRQRLAKLRTKTIEKKRIEK